MNKQKNIPNGMRLNLKKGDSGIFFGNWKPKKPWRYVGLAQGEEGNIMVIGGNGSGKSAGIAKPTLLTWKGAMCVTDIKGELSHAYEDLFDQGVVTRPYIIFDPMQEDGPSYDPFYWLMQDGEINLIRNIRELAATIAPIPSDDKDPFWPRSAQAVLAAALLYYFQLGLSFSETICRITSITLSDLCNEIGGSQIKMILGQIESVGGKALGGIDWELRNHLMVFAIDPHISHVFRGKREGAKIFSWDDLDNYNIFLRIPAEKVDQWGSAIALMYTQLIQYLERRPEKHSADGENYKETLLVMDEFARLGKMEMITSAMATLRSKKVNICLMIQSMAQLDKIYGSDDRRIIFDNCQYQVILRANDAETQKCISELIGTRIYSRNSVGVSFGPDSQLVGYSRSAGDMRDWIVFPHELSTLTDVLLLTPYGFCRVDKFLPGKEAWHRLSSSVRRPRLVPQVERHASIDDPIDLGILDTIAITEGTKMLTIEKRNANANKRVKEKLLRQPAVQENERVMQERDSKCFSRAIGEMLLQFFPEACNLEEGFQKGEADWLRPLEGVISKLFDNQKLVEDMKRDADWPDFTNTNV